MEKCIQETSEGLQEEDGVEEMMSLAGISFDEFITCCCEKLEENYDSYIIANEKMDEKSEEDIFYDVEYTGLDLNGNRYSLKSEEAYAYVRIIL